MKRFFVGLLALSVLIPVAAHKPVDRYQAGSQYYAYPYYRWSALRDYYDNKLTAFPTRFPE